MKRNFLYILGIVLLAVGIIGFFNDPIFGIFDVDTENNIVLIVTGLLSLYFGGAEERTVSTYGIVMTVLFGVLSVAGLIVPTGELFGFLAHNPADTVLHIAITLAFLYVAFAKESFPSRSVRA